MQTETFAVNNRPGEGRLFGFNRREYIKNVNQSLDEQIFSKKRTSDRGKKTLVIISGHPGQRKERVIGIGSGKWRESLPGVDRYLGGIRHNCAKQTISLYGGKRKNESS